jgi:type III secretion protein V
MVPLVVPVSVEIGTALSAEIHGGREGGAFLEDEVPIVRDELFLDLGVALPGVRVRESPSLPANGYAILLQEIPVATGEARPGHLFVRAPAASLPSWGIAAGEAAVDPATGAAGAWTPAASRGLLEAAGVVPLGVPAFVARHLEREVRRRASDFVGLQEVQSMLDQLERAYPALIRNVVPKPVPLALLTDVLRRLVEEGVSIRTLREILEALAIHAPGEKDPVLLTEAVRGALRRHISHAHARGGVLAVYLVDPSIEDTVRSAIQRTATGSYLALAPSAARDIGEAVRKATKAAQGRVVLLTQSDVRRFVRRLVEVDHPDLVVLGYQELDPAITVHPLGRVSP